jgi:hypothetical protein
MLATIVPLHPSDHKNNTYRTQFVSFQDDRQFTRMKKIAALAVIGTAFCVAWTRYRLQLWERAIQEWQDDLLQGPKVDAPRTQQSWDDLPDVVQRYFSEAIRLPTGTEIRSVRFSQRGTFQTHPDNAWTSFTAEQVVSANPPGFVWDASIAMFPYFDRWPLIQMCHAWTQGKAALTVALLNVWELALVPHHAENPIRQSRMDKELELGEAMRWLAESFLVPTSLLPAEGLVVWIPVVSQDGTPSANQALLHLQDSFHLPEARLVVTFDESSKMPIRIYGFRPAWLDSSQDYVITEWQGFFEEFQQLDVGGGVDDDDAVVLVPAHMKLGWIHPGTGDLELYFEGFNYDLAFSFEAPAPSKKVVVEEHQPLSTTIA